MENQTNVYLPRKKGAVKRILTREGNGEMGVLRIFTVHILRARDPLHEAHIESSHKHKIYVVHLETQGLASPGPSTTPGLK